MPRAESIPRDVARIPGAHALPGLGLGKRAAPKRISQQSVAAPRSGPDFQNMEPIIRSLEGEVAHLQTLTEAVRHERDALRQEFVQTVSDLVRAAQPCSPSLRQLEDMAHEDPLYTAAASSSTWSTQFSCAGSSGTRGQPRGRRGPAAHVQMPRHRPARHLAPPRFFSTVRPGPQGPTGRAHGPATAGMEPRSEEIARQAARSVNLRKDQQGLSRLLDQQFGKKRVLDAQLLEQVRSPRCGSPRARVHLIPGPGRCSHQMRAPCKSELSIHVGGLPLVPRACHPGATGTEAVR